AAYGSRVIGVVLSGALDDGTSGLARIKQKGGTAIVQDPDEAVSPGMPMSAIRHVDVDYVLQSAEIGDTLVRLAAGRGQEPMPSQDDKPDIAEVGSNRLDSDEGAQGAPTSFTCPECGGTLRESVENGLSRFKCHVGHAYSIDALAEGQSESLEHALWTALRAL